MNSTSVHAASLTGVRVWDYWIERGYPNPKGLLFGLFCVVVGQILVICYHFARRSREDRVSIQKVEPELDFLKEIKGHLCRVESFFLVFSYLSLTWMLDLMPPSYYNWDGQVRWSVVLAQLLVVDFFTWLAHWLEHQISVVYWYSHLSHHAFVNPKLFDAFNGSIFDTCIMILTPLFITAWIVQFANNWEYAAFGTVYANYFMLIHSEYNHFWDPLFRLLGVGTAEDHNVHHILFKYNFGHFFMYWDKLFGTYRDPVTVEKIRRCAEGVASVAKQKRQASGKNNGNSSKSPREAKAAHSNGRVNANGHAKSL